MIRQALLALTALSLCIPTRGRAQEGASPDDLYRGRREQLLKELEATQQQLADIRGQRVQLQARIENVIAQVTQERARALLMTNETNALQQLDAILTTSQDNLLAQRDRFLALGDAVRRRSGAVLVVLLRADSSTEQRLDVATLTVDNAEAATRTYSATANGALKVGAVDQLYRANVLPTAHTVAVQVTVNGQALAQSVSVNASGESVTYVQFAVRNGQVAPSTWTSRGTTPF